MYDSIKKIVVIGFGSIGRRHVRIIQGLFPKIKIAILRHDQCDKKYVDELRPFYCVDSIEKAIEFRPDAAIVASPATKHLDFVELLAKAGIHMLIEKPIAATSEGVQTLLKLCHKNRVILMTAYNLRFLPSLIEFRSQLQQKKVGNMLSVRVEVGQYLPNWRPDCDYQKTVSAQKELGGGVLLELSHEIDYISWLFGPIKWVKSHVAKQSNLEIDVEDSANIILGFGGPLKQQLVATLCMDFFRHDTTRQCTVIGENGSLRWNGVTGEVKYFPESGQNWEVLLSSKPERDHTYIKEIHHFFSSIEQANLPLISGQDGLETVLVIEAVHKSSNIGRVVYL
jgi:predicted dehydrogenase